MAEHLRPNEQVRAEGQGLTETLIEFSYVYAQILDDPAGGIYLPAHAQEIIRTADQATEIFSRPDSLFTLRDRKVAQKDERFAQKNLEMVEMGMDPGVYCEFKAPSGERIEMNAYGGYRAISSRDITDVSQRFGDVGPVRRTHDALAKPTNLGLGIRTDDSNMLQLWMELSPYGRDVMTLTACTSSRNGSVILQLPEHIMIADRNLMQYVFKQHGDLRARIGRLIDMKNVLK
ncbi:hypothetical protein IPM65_04195 [Candidatus Roizmanbacteria bacterium]|nr:MAG: hypothetical protein IPM65_04195 [Candidatus Roizmanbacteria bacterium]